MIIAGTFLPMAGATLLSTLFRCVEKPKLLLYASIVSAILNTILNYILIFGKCGFSLMGARGAAIATAIPQVYFILSLEECIRFGMSVIVFRKKKWMNSLEAEAV